MLYDAMAIFFAVHINHGTDPYRGKTLSDAMLTVIDLYSGFLAVHATAAQRCSYSVS